MGFLDISGSWESASMKGGKCLAILTGIVLFWVVFGLNDGVWGADNKVCMECHQDEALSKLDAQGRKVSLSVSEAEYKQSVHGKLACWDCHTRIRDEAHAGGGLLSIRDQVNCDACHAKAAREFRQSLHAKTGIKGTGPAARCYDCHGKHSVYPSKDPRSMVNPSNIARTCDRCHSNIEFVREHALGIGTPPGELFKESVHAKTGEVTCTSCHGSHDLRSEIDPKSSIF